MNKLKIYKLYTNKIISNLKYYGPKIGWWSYSRYDRDYTFHPYKTAEADEMYEDVRKVINKEDNFFNFLLKLERSKISDEQNFTGTYAEWKFIAKLPSAEVSNLLIKKVIKPSHESDSGSMYWYTEEGVFRASDHWGKVGSSHWYISNLSYLDHEILNFGSRGRDIYICFCPWSEFHGFDTWWESDRQKEREEYLNSSKE